MAVLPIRMYPDPVLREPAAAVGSVDDSVRKLIADMGETMKAADGLGLAAPQVGVQRRVLVYRVGEDGEVHGLIDPEILSAEGEQTREEGCLSIPGIGYEVTRPNNIRVRAMTPDGEVVTYDAEELEARVIQHEVDHLDGVLFIDRIDRESRREALSILRERALDGHPTPTPRIPSGRPSL